MAGPNVLVLCHGNINRSPLCAAVLRSHGLNVVSAGFVNPGRRASKKMRDAAIELGLNLEEHRSQLLTPELYGLADLIIYMDGGNLKRLTAFEEENGLRVRPCRKENLAYHSQQMVGRIPDPAFIARGTQEFHDVVVLIKECSDKLAQKLIAER